MKKILVLVLLCIFCMPLFTAAAPKVSVYINGKVQNYSQMPILKNGSALVPLRGIFESLGAKIQWNESSQTVSAVKGSKSIKLVIGSKIAYVNDLPIQLSTPAQVINGSTMVPLRFVSESLGGSVRWDSLSSSAQIFSEEVQSGSQNDSTDFLSNKKINSPRKFVFLYENRYDVIDWYGMLEETLVGDLYDVLLYLKDDINNNELTQRSYSHVKDALEAIEYNESDRGRNSQMTYAMIEPVLSDTERALTFAISSNTDSEILKTRDEAIEVVRHLQSEFDFSFSRYDRMKIEIPKRSTPKKSGYGIDVYYGNHTYGSNNQEEYDIVMEIVHDALIDLDRVEVISGRYAEYYQKYLDNLNNWDKNDRFFQRIDRSLGDLVRAGLSKDEIIELYQISIIANNLSKGKNDPRTGAPKSAYDALIRGISDCDSHAQVQSAVFDAMGYSTAIIAGNNHAEVLVKIEGKWYGTAPGSFYGGLTEIPLKSGNWYLSRPTF